MKQQPSVSERQKASKTSKLLTSEENEQVFGLLGRKCQSLCTTVAQIYTTEASAHSRWKKKYTGALCFIKDSSKRSYFFRMYCLLSNDLVWEHELYDTLKLTLARPYLLTYEGEDGHIALNFASEDECKAFHRATILTIENRNRKRQERRSRPKSHIAPSAPSNNNTTTTTDGETTKVQLRNHPTISSMQILPNSNSATPMPSMTTNKASLAGTQFSKKDKKKGRGLTKADISTPMNFVHVSHVGWDAQKGFDLTGSDDDEMLKNFFNKAGVSQQELNDRDTRAFIYDFVQSNNVLESVKSERVEKPKPPPVPTRQNQNGTPRTAPPPPPQRQPPPPVPSTPSIPRGPPPSRPPPISTTTTAQTTAPAPPPPPPPPPQVLAPPPPPMPEFAETDSKILPPSSPNDARSALMNDIKSGRTLRKVDQSTLSSGSNDSRNELLSDIRKGVTLRPAQERELPSGSNRGSDNSGDGTDVLAAALRAALLKREIAIQSSDENTDDSSDNDGEWED